MAKEVGVVKIFVALRDLVGALAQLLVAWILKLVGIARVWSTGRHGGGQAEGIVDLAQQDQAAVGGDVQRVKMDVQRQLRVERETGLCGTLCQRGEVG